MIFRSFLHPTPPHPVVRYPTLSFSATGDRRPDWPEDYQSCSPDSPRLHCDWLPLGFLIISSSPLSAHSTDSNHVSTIQSPPSQPIDENPKSTLIEVIQQCYSVWLENFQLLVLPVLLRQFSLLENLQLFVLPVVLHSLVVRISLCYYKSKFMVFVTNVCSIWWNWRNKYRVAKMEDEVMDEGDASQVIRSCSPAERKQVGEEGAGSG
ncbi:hypothetical protein RHMOL_Rhmol12G0067200 [Rhododendron molle]|uniref:Uncharacterized protein n=1 Tax=Rhododendron molle TaxID=49168 RepID=A0ACC0LG24_RHOML|nr:hypothetical protein RHMOL_Rhmol12G0067200 [Rhododendron molle]